MADENQQVIIPSQPPVSQSAVGSMTIGSSMDVVNHHHVSTAMTVNSGPLNVSQAPSIPGIPATVNTSSGTAHMTLSAPTPAPAAVISQNSGHHQAMIQPISSIQQNQLPQVQVIQQPLSASYLQQLYTPQQQMIFPGNLTLQPTSMTAQALQGIGAQGLSLQLQAKGPVDPKTSGSTLQTVNSINKGIPLGSSNMMATAGQVIGSGGKSCLTPQMLASTAKPSTVLHSQSGFGPSANNQTVVIGQLGVLPNQQSIFPNHHKTLVDQQKGKTYMVNQQATLQPKSPIYPSSASIPTSNQLFNGNQLKQLTSQPQIITSQAPATMLTQAQILGSIQALGTSLPPGLTWATPGCLQPSALLAQNPILIRSQQSDMYIQSPPPTAVHLPVAASAPLPTSFASASVSQKPKQVRPSSVATQTSVSSFSTVQPQATPFRSQAKVKSRTISSHLTPGSGGVNSIPQMATSQTQTQQQQAISAQPPESPQLKTDAANQTKPSPEMKSIATQSKTVSTETKQHFPHLLKLQAQVPPSTKSSEIATVGPTQAPPVISTATSTTSTCTDSTVSSPSVTVDTNVVLDTPLVDSSACNAEPLSSSVPFNLPSEDAFPMNETKVEEPSHGIKPLCHSVKDKQPQKAIVKPQILTHVIDGYIIQEGPEPFPVSRSSLLTETVLPKVPIKEISDNLTGTTKVIAPERKQKLHKHRRPVELAKCEFCEKLGAKSKFKKSKRFCSKSCAKRYNLCCSKRVGLLSSSQNIIETGKVSKKKKMGFKRKGWRKGHARITSNDSQWQQVPEENQDQSIIPGEGNTTSVNETSKMHELAQEADILSKPEISSLVGLSSNSEEMEVDMPNPICSSNVPGKWTVQEVWDFVRSLPGCSDYADEFRSQEIDGQALLLLKEDHLISAMNMKLGPALKLIARVNDIKEASHS